MHAARYWDSLGDGKVHCTLCPHGCVIQEGRYGICGARKNISGKLYSMAYGKPVAVNVDPIEKKPLFHFLPGSYSLSLGTAGCNLSCMHCQNWDIARASPEKIEAIELSPEDIVRMAKKKACKSISYTYNEPTVFHEFASDCARLARKAGLKNVIVTNGFINKEPRDEFIELMDAANIDLKAFDDSFYRDVCKARLEPVLETLKGCNQKIWLEITNLVINGRNDDLEQIDRMCQWVVKNLGDSVPLHFSRAHPMYMMRDIEPTYLRTLEKAKEIAEKYLNYVYIGNVAIEGAGNTYCPECKNLLIERDFYTTERRFEKACPECGKMIEGVFNGNQGNGLL